MLIIFCFSASKSSVIAWLFVCNWLLYNCSCAWFSLSAGEKRRSYFFATENTARTQIFKLKTMRWRRIRFGFAWARRVYALTHFWYYLHSRKQTNKIREIFPFKVFEPQPHNTLHKARTHARRHRRMFTQVSTSKANSRAKTAGAFAASMLCLPFINQNS